MLAELSAPFCTLPPQAATPHLGLQLWTLKVSLGAFTKRGSIALAMSRLHQLFLESCWLLVGLCSLDLFLPKENLRKVPKHQDLLPHCGPGQLWRSSLQQRLKWLSRYVKHYIKSHNHNVWRYKLELTFCRTISKQCKICQCCYPKIVRQSRREKWSRVDSEIKEFSYTENEVYLPSYFTLKRKLECNSRFLFQTYIKNYLQL